jgi:bifunctional DNA-binding transcriptional regulator/antitoxin component of YhaV-PrlF toxin-antitoxin module
MTKSWTLTFDAKGKLTLPPDLLEHLRWKPGEPIRVITQGDAMILERKRALLSRVFGSLTPPPQAPMAQADSVPTPPAKNVSAASSEVMVNGH